MADRDAAAQVLGLNLAKLWLCVVGERSALIRRLSSSSCVAMPHILSLEGRNKADFLNNVRNLAPISG
jgi:hypothetical protein